MRDVYLVVPIYDAHRRYLRFNWQGDNFEFLAMPFGLVSAPRVFTKIGLHAEVVGDVVSFLDNHID